MVDHSSKKLGRLPARHDPRVARLAAFVTTPHDPPEVTWGAGIPDWQDWWNTQLGDCTAEAKGHMFMAHSQEVRKLWTPTREVVIGFYEGSCGYRPGQPSTDNGGVMVDVLHYLLTRGLGGHRIAAFGSVQPKDRATVRHVIASLGGLDVGVSLPVSAQTEDVWGESTAGDGSGEPGSWGGHCVYVNGYDAEHVKFISWGKQMLMTWDFWDRYVDEAYGVLSGAWIREGRSPAGIDVAALLGYTERLRA